MDPPKAKWQWFKLGDDEFGGRVGDGREGRVRRREDGSEARRKERGGINTTRSDKVRAERIDRREKEEMTDLPSQPQQQKLSSTS